MSENAETNMKAGADFFGRKLNTMHLFTFDHGKDLQMQSVTKYNKTFKTTINRTGI